MDSKMKVDISDPNKWITRVLTFRVLQNTNEYKNVLESAHKEKAKIVPYTNYINVNTFKPSVMFMVLPTMDKKLPLHYAVSLEIILDFKNEYPDIFKMIGGING